MKPTHWIIIGLAAVIVFLLLTDKDPSTVDLAPYETAIAIADHQIDSLTKSNRATIKRIQEDSIIQAEERESFKTKLNAISRRQDIRRPQVLQQIDSLPIVKAFIETQDSVIYFQSARIYSLELDKVELRVDIRTITDNFIRQMEAQESKIQATQALADAYKKEARRSKRSARWLKAGAVALGVGGLFLGAQL